MKNLKPHGDRLLVVKEVVQESRTASGIILSEPVETNIQYGTVLAVGTGSKLPVGSNEPSTSCSRSFAQGDRICWLKFQGIELDEEHVMLREDDVLGITQPQ